MSSVEWMDEAVCTTVGTEPFFPEKGQNPAPAVAVCRACPVRVECLNYALELEQSGVWNVTGIWGGLTARERRNLRRRTLRPVA